MKSSKELKRYLIPNEYLEKIQGAMKKDETYVLCCPYCHSTSLKATLNIGIIHVVCLVCKKLFQLRIGQNSL